jgi:predicted branched-subunit amino acid permease
MTAAPASSGSGGSRNLPVTDPGSRGFRFGTARGLPLALVVGMFGVVFGALAAATDRVGAVPAVAMSVITFAGSAQFAAVSVLSEGGQTLPAAAAAIMLNLRYVPIGVTVAPYLRGAWWRRLLVSQLIVDESWAVASRAGGRYDIPVLAGVGVVLWLAWVGGTVIGVVGGRALGDPAALGLDAAFPALFLALLAAHLRGRRSVVAAVMGGGLALVLVPFVPPGVPIVAAGLAALLGLLPSREPTA